MNRPLEKLIVMYKTLEMTDNAIILEYSLSAKIWNYPPLSSVTQWHPSEQEKGRKTTNTSIKKKQLNNQENRNKKIERKKKEKWGQKNYKSL